jgi:hypothetical protein
MKRKIHLALIVLFSVSFKIMISQNSELLCEINKDNPNEYLISNFKKETIFKVVSDTLYNVTNSNRYTLSYQKNEKWNKFLGAKFSKLYLIKMLNDTLAIITKKNDIIKLTNKTIKCLETETGWKYINSEGEVMCEVVHSWNNVSWYFKIVGNTSFYENEALSVITLMSLQQLAEDFSERKDNSGILVSDVWFIMWLVGCVSTK